MAVRFCMLAGLLSLLATGCSLLGLGEDPEGKLAGSGFFGANVALQGSHAIVSATFAGRAGQAHVFARTETGWSEQHRLAPSELADGARFGLSVALSERFVAASTRHSHGVYVYAQEDRDHQVRLPSSGAGSDVLYGSGLDAHAGYLVVSAPGEEVEGIERAGAVFVYRSTGSAWEEKARITAPDPSDGALFGRELAFDGRRIIVGTRRDSIYRSSGAVYVVEQQGDTWSRPSKLVARGVVEYDQFGYDVDVDGSYAVAGSPGRKGGPNPASPEYDPEYRDFGAAYIFEHRDGVWTEQTMIMASDAARVDRFGYSVAIDGDYLVAGAPYESRGTGAAYVFVRRDGQWRQQAKLTAPDGHRGGFFGEDVDISGRRILVGAPGQDGEEGAAYVFRRAGSTWKLDG